MYVPKPVDTSGIELEGELAELLDKLAENVHEVWAENRIAEGWSYGTERNDEHKTTPCLVPFTELSETDKNYDRNTASETLKFIISLGYKITKPEDEEK